MQCELVDYALHQLKRNFYIVLCLLTCTPSCRCFWCFFLLLLFPLKLWCSEQRRHKTTVGYMYRYIYIYIYIYMILYVCSLQLLFSPTYVCHCSSFVFADDKLFKKKKTVSPRLTSVSIVCVCAPSAFAWEIHELHVGKWKGGN
ncbi:hypothetical protein, unlikely [Trypanosoma brucei gambiense DAL972]|uniref:Uncharacterized protein n=1 Tax=Trypanosoma brucei gambiense (strain MHOM/CI/86/DAL972) TaxID=679716 RepID=C9ZPJ2_TRYB9|nr:hypothetical protein, unlikely [Trypanosoma brucei gambiense DAL972]CBH11320.1 hypothetical protein, unlikely [Trypanosoma brucei gambiense DAL972]|eukprot:XP_011773607.1 hypothetical protein, unlikely [Trypanosoma brucei gambiense DAL972]